MTDKTNPSLSLSNPQPEGVTTGQKAGLVMVGLGLLLFIISGFGLGTDIPLLSFLLTLGFITVGSGIFIFQRFHDKIPGVKNNRVWLDSLTSRGSLAWVLGVAITGFYILLYWHDRFHALDHIISMFNPLSELLRGKSADQWFVYGSLYTLAVVIMGVKAIYRYRHTNYQVIRTLSVMFVQLFLAFLIPSLLVLFKQPEFYFSYFWPLKYDYLFPSTLESIAQHPGGWGVFFVTWAVMMTFVATPFLTYFYGKRWYCSWACGCGGLANTAGDDFRQLSNKSLDAWKIERWMIHSVLVIITVGTALLWVNSYTQGAIFGTISQQFSEWYGFYIGMIFSGVIGVGFYPLMGTRVWCRFGCPMAAILGIQQKFFSRFRITTNGGQCISCGNCSTYCEMGIDVKWYAQRGQNIVRASCVGCGMCSTVCPRGVLNLENGSYKNKVSDDPIIIGNDGAKINLKKVQEQT